MEIKKASLLAILVVLGIVMMTVLTIALPTITIGNLTPANNTYQSQNWSYFNFTSDENLDMTYLYLHNNTAPAAGPRNMSNDSQTHWYLNLTLDEYAYNWTVQMVNTSNLTHSTNSSMYYFTIDYTAPTAELGVYPVDNYNSSLANVWFLLRCNDSTSTINHLDLWSNFSGTWKYNQTNITATNAIDWNITVDGITDGSYIWGVFGNDSAGNSDFSTNRTLLVDTITPLISFNVPNTIANGNGSARTTIISNISLTETNLFNVTYRLTYQNGSSVNSTTYTSSVKEVNFTTLGEYNYTYNVTACDKVDKCNTTDTYLIILDRTNPFVQVNGTATVAVDTVYTIKYDTTDSNLNGCYYNLSDYNTGASLLSDTALNCSAMSQTFTPSFFTYKVTVWAKDLADNVNITSMIVSTYKSGGGGGSSNYDYPLTTDGVVNETTSGGGGPSEETSATAEISETTGTENGTPAKTQQIIKQVIIVGLIAGGLFLILKLFKVIE